MPDLRDAFIQRDPYNRPIRGRLGAVASGAAARGVSALSRLTVPSTGRGGRRRR
jgi:hypothetical protein